MVGRLVLLAISLVSLAGCSSDVGPNDPKMNSAEEQKLRENTLTPEQREARESRPR
ncbi:MAG: hypothetical protein IT363_04010 [Methanoregulaceae archaeon]|nr:hypothetical protein [Methanoregulaceae archaeon]